MSPSNVITIVTSTRPRAGCTLLARLLVDFYLQDGRTAAAFDLNGADKALSEFLPGHAAPADVSNIYGQMALFDRLAATDGARKVIDLGPEVMKPFFSVMNEIDLAGEARRTGTATVILFIATPDDAAAAAFAALRRDCPAAIVVPVHNEYLGEAQHRDRFAASGTGAVPLHMPALAPGLRRLIERRPFTFSDSTNMALLGAGPEVGNTLQRWRRRMYVEFREMELRVLLGEVQGSLAGRPR